MGFKSGEKLVVEQIDDETWELREAFSYEGKFETFTVPMGTRTDFASVPRVFVWFIPKYGRYTKPAILHDWLCREKAATGQMTWADADGIFRRAMREEGVAFLRRWLMWAAVRVGSLTKPGGTKGFLPELPQLLPFAAIGIGVLTIPAIVIAVALLIYAGIEAIFWVPLKLIELVQKKAGKPSKQVNPPAESVKT